MSEKYYMCLVCGFNLLKEPPYDQGNSPSYEICPCCGFEFGVDGANNQIIFTDFRQAWIKNGAQWFIPKLKPKDWDFKKQLSNLNKDVGEVGGKQ